MKISALNVIKYGKGKFFNQLIIVINNFFFTSIINFEIKKKQLQFIFNIINQSCSFAMNFLLESLLHSEIRIKD